MDYKVFLGIKKFINRTKVPIFDSVPAQPMGEASAASPAPCLPPPLECAQNFPLLSSLPLSLTFLPSTSSLPLFSLLPPLVSHLPLTLSTPL